MVLSLSLIQLPSYFPILTWSKLKLEFVISKTESPRPLRVKFSITNSPPELTFKGAFKNIELREEPDPTIVNLEFNIADQASYKLAGEI